MFRIDINIFNLLAGPIYYEELVKFTKSLGSINRDDSRGIIQVFRDENLKCLSTISYYGYTIFNKLQVKEIKKEINDKVIQKAMPGYVIELINNASDKVLSSKEDCYLVFDGE